MSTPVWAAWPARRHGVGGRRRAGRVVELPVADEARSRCRRRPWCSSHDLFRRARDAPHAQLVEEAVEAAEVEREAAHVEEPRQRRERLVGRGQRRDARHAVDVGAQREASQTIAMCTHWGVVEVMPRSLPLSSS